jgi:hypothetical protein
LKPPAKGLVSDKTLKSAESAYKKGQNHEPISKTRSVAREKALKREPSSAASHSALSRQAREAAKKRSPAEKSRAAKKAVETKGLKQLSAATKKAAKT